MNRKENLEKLYMQKSKHSNYQILSSKLSTIINTDLLETTTRYEEERLKFIVEHIKINGKTLLDIGGNSGFFSFELLDRGLHKVFYYEGNKTHAEFVKLSSELLNIREKIYIFPEYFDFEVLSNKQGYDITLLLNVLHHIGDDFGETELSMKKAKEKMMIYLNKMAGISEYMVFQLGFNWKGNREKALFENGTKKEMIDFIKESVKNNWDIIKIGAASEKNNQIIYEELNDKNIQRMDRLGEFLNRPIFIMKSKIYN